MRGLLPATWILVAASAVSAAPPADDAARRDLLPAPPGVTSGSLGAVVNPAAWATGAPGGDLSLWWNDRSFQEHALDNWGISLGGPVGFSAERRTFAGARGERLRVHEYRIGTAHGNGRSHWGVAWRWATGDDGAFRREGGLELGLIERPGRRLSWGLSSFLSAGSDRRNAVADVGIRPFGTSALTLFADWTLTSRQRLDDGSWSAGAEIRPWRGIHLGARARDVPGRDDVEWRLNLGITLDRLALHVLPSYDEDGDRGDVTYVVRSNPPYRGLPVRDALRSVRGRRRYEVIDLENRLLTYQRDQWFDEERVAWIDLGRRIRAIRADPAVAGVAVKVDGLRVRPSILWELRRELEACRDAGKEIVVHFDRLGMAGYYLASVGDRIAMDPNGRVHIPGIALQRTYQKGLLDKLGIGFEELRFLPYKTAVQTYSRTDMSDADREQYGREADVLYETFRDGVCVSRGLTHGEFDVLVDGRGWLRGSEALDAGLVDELGRWSDLTESLAAKGVVLTAETRVGRGQVPGERWGRPPTVALVYARGLCAMDSGIRGRATSRHLRRLARRADVAAVVLRSDSPGGDRLPSDLVAEGMRRIRGQGKPVVASQGDVAASGGYWISMEADRVFTTPLTVTGSIGVISGWVWDAGLGEKTGFSADGVQRGAHADLFSGIRFPWIHARLPTRPLTEDERARSRELILGMYGEFVGRVAEARGLSVERVRELGGGRVWMGPDAVERGLCDAAGTLLDAVADAATWAGLDPNDIVLEEFPPRKRFRLPRLLPGLPLAPWFLGRPASAAGESASDYGLQYLRAVAGSPGEPMLLAPPEALPASWAEDPAPGGTSP